MPESLRGRQRWGGITLSYTGNVLEVWAQITFQGVGGGSVDEIFNILEEPGSDTREAVWLMPKQSTAVIALGNSSTATIRTTARFSDGDLEEVEIPAGATKFIRRKEREGDTDSVKLTTSGPAGSMRVTGFIVANDRSFTSSIRFYDTKKTVQPNLYATNLRLKKTVPRMVLKNTSEAVISARPRFFAAAGEQANPIELPAMTLRPNQVIDVDLSVLSEAVASRRDIDSVSVQVVNSGTPGSLIGAAYSGERATQLTHDVPLRDSGKNRMGTGSYPWRVDRDYSTVVTMTNVGNQPARFQVELRYPGGPYSIKPRELAVGETATFDLEKMRDAQQPDRLGHTLPRALDQGQFHWSTVATPGESHLIGRAEVISRSERVSSSYSCFTCCQDSGPIGGFNPHGYTIYVDGFEQTSSSGLYYDCYNNNYWTSIYWSSLWTSNTNVATINGSEELYGVDGGFTYANGSYYFSGWNTDGMDCYPYGYTAGDNAPVQVPSPEIIFNGSGVPLASGTPPANTWPSYVDSVTMHVNTNFTGGTFLWSTTSNKVTLTEASKTTDTVTVKSVSASAARNDVTIKVVWTIEGKPYEATKTTTVQKPASLKFVSYGAHENSAASCATGFQGKVKDINWQLQDHLNPAANIAFAIPGTDTLPINTGQNGCSLTLAGTPPSEQQYTSSTGGWSHTYSFCTDKCACSSVGVQKYFFNGFPVDLPFTFACSGITVSGK
jgi:hypothetical protein